MFLEVTLSLLEGFGTTCLIFILTLVFALPLGLAISFCTMSKFKPLKYIFKVFVWIIRGVPLMLQILIVYYLPGIINSAKKNTWTAIDKDFLKWFEVDLVGTTIAILIAFILNYACYFSEIFRGGIESIPKGQIEAGKVLGMTKAQIFKHITLMQVVKRIIPPMSNEIITLVKDTALARILSVHEIIHLAFQFANDTFNPIYWPLFYSGLFYLIFVGLLTLLFGYLEKKLSYYKV